MTRLSNELEYRWATMFAIFVLVAAGYVGWKWLG